MIQFDEDSLICDLAETYNIYDYKQLPVLTVAVFSCGLKEDSRIKLKLSGQNVSLETLLLAGMSDKLSAIIWLKSKDAQSGRNKPKSIVELLSANSKSSNSDGSIAFETASDYERARQELIGGDVNGN
ncbi:DUF5361 domain-containing protein [Vagococcus carniphilus]|uniref:DUF5361 domain-containing protein n=1 Tax=Vagococcus carniphilus TaxID=218144 RepID=UPI00288D3AB9|nr:DUF5361 domain-containing protein [Vagococcus carniphilus]MDT2848759.1 DUF5361 domain-containing protein [Vagococcus carniphilus]